MKKQIKHKSRKINDISFLGRSKVNKVRKLAYPKDILEVKVFQNKNNKQFNLPVMKRSTSPRIIKELLNNKNVIGLKFKVADVIYKNATGKDVIYKNKMNSPLKLSKKHYNTNLRKSLKIPNTPLKYNVSKTRQMNWKQLKQKYPNMKPTADADFDGLINMKDCKPLDPSKDGMFSRFIGRVTGDKYGQTEKEYEEEKEIKKEGKEQIKEIKRERKIIVKEEKARVKEKKYQEKAVEQIKEKGYAFPRKIRGEMMEERLQELRAKFKAYAKEKEKKFKPEKTLVGRVLKKALPTATYKTVMVKGKKKRVAVTTGGLVSAKQRGAIVKTAERFAGVRGPTTRTGKTAKGQKLDGAGRPKGTYKYKDPRTGEPITAIKYHALRKKLKRQAKTVETRAEVQQRFALAKRGLSPEEVSMAREAMEEKMARLRALKEAKQMEVVEDLTTEGRVPEITEEVEEEQIQQIPEQAVRRQVQPQYQRVGHQGVPPGYRLQEDLMTGKKKLVPLPQPEAWTR